MLLAHVLLGVALAHHPHDPVPQFAVSPAFAVDGLALATRTPAQNWRPFDLMRTGDGLGTWTYSGHGVTNVALPVDLVVSPRFDVDGVAFLTTAGDGAWISTDAGLSWSPTLPGRTLGQATAAHDGVGPVLLVHEEGGAVLRSADLGRTWSDVAAPASVVAMSSFDGAIAFAEPETLWLSDDAGATFASRPFAGGLVADLSVGPGVVVLAADDGVWVSEVGEAAARVPGFTGEAARVGVSPDWAADHTIAATRTGVGVYLSDDAGATFELHDIGLLPVVDQSEDHYLGVQFSRRYATDRTMFVHAFEGLFASLDAGATWFESDTRPPPIVTTIEPSPTFASDQILFVGSYDAGAWTSTDGGTTLAPSSDGLARASPYSIDLATVDGDLLALAALRDIVQARVGTTGAWRVEGSPQTEYPTIIAMAPDIQTSGVVLLGTRRSGIQRSTDRGRTWSQAADVPLDTTSIAWGADGATVLAGNMGLLVISPDAGVSWGRVTDVPTLPSFPVLAASGPDGFLVGTWDGAYESPDGARFTRVDGVPGPVEQVYAAADGTRFAAARGGLLFRSDGGGPFVRIAAGFEAMGTPHELSASPDFAADGTLYASRDDHVFRSVDRGEQWSWIGPATVRYEEDTQVVTPTQIHNQVMQDDGASVTHFSFVEPDQVAGFKFTGVAVGWIGPVGSAWGEADVELDGVIVDHVVQTAAAPLQQQVLWSASGLVSGPHEVRLHPTTGARIALDAMEIVREDPFGEAPEETGDTGGTTPPTTADTGETGEDHTGSTTTPTDDPETDGTGEDDDGKCGCAGGGLGAAPASAWVVAVALARRRRSARAARTR